MDLGELPLAKTGIGPDRGSPVILGSGYRKGAALMENFRRGQEDVPLGLPRGLGGGNTLISLEKTVVFLGRTACLHFLRFWFVTVLLANDQKKWIVDTTSWM